MSTPPIRIIVGDDHPIMVEALCSLLSSHEQVTVVATAHSFPELAAAAVANPADIVVLDLTGMHSSPWAMLQSLQRDAPHLKIIIFSSKIDLAPELLSAGAAGYVAKEERTTVLLNAISVVASGGLYCSPHVEQYLAQASGERSFTPQEWVTIKLLAEELDTGQTAEIMGVGPRSVQNYVTSMLRKKGFTNRYQLIEWYRRTYGLE